MTVNQKIAMYQQRSGLPQTLLAGWLGMSVPTYKRITNSGRDVSPDELARLVEKTGIELPIWMQAELTLPDPLPTVTIQLAPRGRPERVKTGSTNTVNAQRVVRLKQVITDHYEGNARRLSEALLMDETQLSAILNGRREVSERLILRVSRLAGVAADWLRSGTQGDEVDCVADQHDGDSLREYLTAKGLYWSDLQKALGLSALSSVVEYGNRKELRRETKIRIAAALGVKASDLFGCL